MDKTYVLIQSGQIVLGPDWDSIPQDAASIAQYDAELADHRAAREWDRTHDPLTGEPIAD